MTRIVNYQNSPIALSLEAESLQRLLNAVGILN